MTRKLPPKSDEVEPLMQSVLNAWQPTELEGAALDALVAAALAASPADDSELEAPACDAELLAAARLASLLDGATEEDTSGAEGHLALALRAVARACITSSRTDWSCEPVRPSASSSKVAAPTESMIQVRCVIVKIVQEQQRPTCGPGCGPGDRGHDRACRPRCVRPS